MWPPKTETDIREALESGDLVESHLLELKREAGGGKGERSEIARDLASFALDGGAILYGVEELKAEHRFDLSPLKLEGRVEALEQIAELRIEPPLAIRAREIPTAKDATSGYLFVEVEPTSEAPHMVDGVYYGRGERRRRRLGDAEVRRLHAARRSDADLAMIHIDQTIAADPIPAAERALAHMYLVALPTTASPNVAESVVWDRDRLREVLRGSSRGLTADLAQWAPSPSYASSILSREHGLAWTSLGQDDSSAVREEQLVEFEFREDGSIRVIVGRASTNIAQGVQQDRFAIMDGLVIAYAIRIVNWAAALSSEISYAGSWDFALAITGLTPMPAYSVASNWRSFGASSYMSAEYRSTTRALRREMAEHPNVVAERLLARFLRSLGLVETYRDLFRTNES
jgi:hypothetical protein